MSIKIFTTPLMAAGTQNPKPGPTVIDASFWRDRPLTYPAFPEAVRCGALVNAKKRPKPGGDC